MNRQIRASMSAIAAVVLLASCASKGPVRSAVADGASAEDQTPSEYQSLVDNVSQQVVCRREAVTGSRIASEVCFTQAELKEQRDNAVEVMRTLQERAALARQQENRPPPPPPSAPGR